jgi:hypothetical protein
MEETETPRTGHTQYNLTEAKTAIEAGREIKEYANLIEAKSGGGIGKDLEEIIEETNDLANDLYEDNKEWVDNHLEKLQSILPGAQIEDIKESYINGLNRFIKRQYRTYKKESPKELDILKDKQYLRDSIFAYTFDFILLARQAQKTTESPIRALKIATNANMLSPESLRNLTSKYSELGNAAINMAVIGYPTNPEKFLDRIIESKQKP